MKSGRPCWKYRPDRFFSPLSFTYKRGRGGRSGTSKHTATRNLTSLTTWRTAVGNDDTEKTQTVHKERGLTNADVFKYRVSNWN